MARGGLPGVGGRLGRGWGGAPVRKTRGWGVGRLHSGSPTRGPQAAAWLCSFLLTALRPHPRGRRARAFGFRGQKAAEQRTPWHPEGLCLEAVALGSSCTVRVVSECGGGQRPGHFMKAANPREPGVGPQAGTLSPGQPHGHPLSGQRSAGAGSRAHR